MSINAKEIREMGADETRNVAVNFQGKLADGELLTGAPTAVEVDTTDLTIASEALNASAINVSGKSVLANQAVTFSVTGGTAGERYKIDVTCDTDATPPQTLEARLLLDFC